MISIVSIENAANYIRCFENGEVNDAGVYRYMARVLTNAIASCSDVELKIIGQMSKLFPEINDFLWNELVNTQIKANRAYHLPELDKIMKQIKVS
jgi:hypothetical protein